MSKRIKVLEQRINANDAKLYNARRTLSEKAVERLELSTQNAYEEIESIDPEYEVICC